MITNEDLVAAGYKRYRDYRQLDAYQKTVYDQNYKGVKLYFINVIEYIFPYGPPERCLSVEISYYWDDNVCYNISWSVPDDWSICDIETTARIFYQRNHFNPDPYNQGE